MHITLDNVLASFGAGSMCRECLDFYESHDWSYRTVSPQEKDAVILQLLNMLETDKQVIGAQERIKVWDDGWKENLEAFLETHNIESIYPKFIRTNQIVRFNREFIKPNNPNFERDYATLFVMWFSAEYMKEYKHIYEFGCGSGFNIIPMTEMLPDKHIFGLDFSPSAVQLIKELASTYNLNVESRFFDMAAPDYSFDIESNSVVLTFGAVEQLAGQFHALVDYWLHQKPALVMHVEPTLEFLDPENLLDYLAMKFLQKRGYTQGFVPYLEQLAESGKIEIIKKKRLFFGNLRMEGYNLIIWKPL